MTTRSLLLSLLAIVEHVLAAQYADRVAILDKGNLAALGPVDHVLEPEILSRVFATRILRLQAGATAAYISPAH